MTQLISDATANSRPVIVHSPEHAPAPAHDDAGYVEPEGGELPKASIARRIGTLLVIVVPLLGLAAAIALLWGWGVSWIHLALLAAGYVLTVHGVTIGYHRLFTHKSFTTGPVVKAVLGILGSMAAQGSILTWVANHRLHHQASDRADDPHSPHDHEGGFRGYLRGLFHAHMGWLFRPNPTNLAKYVKDLNSDRLVAVLSKMFPLITVIGLLLPMGIAWAVTGSWVGGVLGLLWGGLARVFLVHHVTWSINSACHLWGSRPFNSHDESRNNPIFGVLAMGEGWHNNHHAFPTSARHGLAWWQFDSSYLVIRAMEMLGLVRDVRIPSPERIAAKRMPVRRGPSPDTR